MAAQSSIFVTDAEVEAVLSMCRVVVAVAARSSTPPSHVLDPAQFRLLVVLSAGDVESLETLTAVTGLNTATVSRMCERMTQAGLIEGEDEALPSERHLRLTEAGRDLFRAGMNHRREAIDAILGRLPPLRRLEFMAVLQEFVAGNPAVDGCRVGAA